MRPRADTPLCCIHASLELLVTLVFSIEPSDFVAGKAIRHILPLDPSAGCLITTCYPLPYRILQYGRAILSNMDEVHMQLWKLYRVMLLEIMS